ncbi:MAG: DUF1016 family protein, partial [Candidatus Accumulibacter sp.]|uniref:PDDEXK nuclease domain-containing protein n=1 Tax=Accumulibacter sp. TaxID=2053492 RepID=UPI001A4ED9C0
SRANLMYMRAFAEAWPDAAIVQQAVGQLPWGHNLVLLTKLKAPEQRLAYAHRAIEHRWSRNVLAIHIERRLLERQGQAITNFGLQLAKPQSDLARESLKDPYLFDFLGIGDEAGERAIEDAIVGHITRFLIELGAGFAFVGRQVLLEVGCDVGWANGWHGYGASRHCERSEAIQGQAPCPRVAIGIASTAVPSYRSGLA